MLAEPLLAARATVIASSHKASQTMVSLLDDPDPRIRQQSASDLLDRSGIMARFEAHKLGELPIEEPETEAEEEVLAGAVKMDRAEEEFEPEEPEQDVTGEYSEEDQDDELVGEEAQEDEGGPEEDEEDDEEDEEEGNGSEPDQEDEGDEDEVGDEEEEEE